MQGFDLTRRSGEVVELDTNLAALYSYVAGQRDDPARALALSDHAAAHLPEDNPFLRCLVAMNQGTALLNLGQPKAAADALREAIRLSAVVALDYFTLILTSLLGQVYEMQGQLQRAFDLHQEALTAATREGAQPAPFAGVAYLGMAEIFYEWNDLDNTRRCALEGIRLSESGDIVDTLLAGHLILGNVYLARGDLERAQTALTDTERFAAHHAHSYVSALIDDLKTRLWITRGDATYAFQWAHTSFGNLDENYDFVQESARLVIARVLLVEASGDPANSSDVLAQVVKLLKQVLDHAGAAGRSQNVIKVSVLQAIAFHLRGDDDEALSCLARALALAAPSGYIRTFVDEGAPMGKLLRQALLRDIEPTYVSRLLVATDEAANSPGNAALVEPLTDREIDVLRLIMAGLSNQEIADTLVIAVSTVKSHVNHIYGKLSVENRTQAVLKAQKLALL
jgi:LuxR family maltose regulon positive regulatory protein